MRENSPTPYVGPPPVPKMPAGLVELVEGLTREVLKNNPKDLYGFCAKHLQKLVEVRDGRPVRNPVLTLEEKILRAQEKVRQKAKERRERYDREFNALKQPENQDVENDKTVESFEESIAKDPVHENQNLALASEVEIAHIFNDDVISVDKSNVVVRLPEISIIKPDDDSPNIQQEGVANEEISDQYNDMRLSPDSGEIVNRSNKAIKNLSTEESITQSILNEQLNEDVKKEDGEKQEAKGTGVEILLEESSVIANDIPDEGLNPSMDSVIVTEQKINIPLSIEKTATEIIEDIKSTETAISVIENDITEPQYKNDINDVVLSEDNNEIKIDEDEHGDVIVEDTEIVKDTGNENINIGNIVVEKVDHLSDTQLEKNSDTIHENSLQNTENNGVQESNKMIEESICIIDDLSLNENESILSENTTTNVDGSLDSTTIQSVNDTNVNQNISKDDLDIKRDVKSEEINTTDNVIEVYDDSGPSSIGPKDIDLIVDVKVPEDNNVEETTVEKIEQVNDNNFSTQVLENIDVTDDTKSLTESDVSKLEDDNGKDNQNQSNMDLETAAVTIQKVFRSFLFKSRNSTFDDITNDEPTSLEEDSDKKEDYYAAANKNKERRTLGINRMDTVLQTVNEEKSLSLSTDDSSTLSSAATTIQAHVRGFLVRNRLNSNKTVSSTSLANSNENMEFDTDQQKNKTVLNIHIVPEESNYLSRDESIITSMELSLDGSPPSSISLHPLSYDVSERRKLLKREDAVQSISPPSNNSGKLSEESVKEVFINDDMLLVNDDIEKRPDDTTEPCNDSGVDSEIISTSSTVTATTVINVTDHTKSTTNSETEDRRSKSLPKMGSDESDVVTPYEASPRSSIGDYENTSKLVHSGEFHDVLLPTRVSRSDTTVVREFKNVLVYFFIWNKFIKEE